MAPATHSWPAAGLFLSTANPDYELTSHRNHLVRIAWFVYAGQWPTDDVEQRIDNQINPSSRQAAANDIRKEKAERNRKMLNNERLFGYVRSMSYCLSQLTWSFSRWSARPEVELETAACTRRCPTTKNNCSGEFGHAKQKS